MVSTIHQLIGKVAPLAFAANGSVLLKQYGSSEKIPAEAVAPKPLSQHRLMSDSPSESLEPIYFFMLDLMNDFGLAPKKVVDTFASSPGSGHFAEIGQRATIMQQQASKLLGDINTVLRSIINLVYDLKEFKIRLELYDDLQSKNAHERDGAKQSLKQLWMDKVDLNKGQSSIKAMALGQAGFQTLMEAFLASDTVEQAKRLDLNERVKRIVIGRIAEFGKWLETSEKELRKRFGIEKAYLRSQVNSLKLYARWARPYLLNARKLEMTAGEGNPALVNAFNTILFQLTLFGRSKFNVPGAVLKGLISPQVGKVKAIRGYYACIVVDFTFRGIPQRVQQQNYSMGGRTEITFSSYILSEDQIKQVEKEIEKADAFDFLDLIEGVTSESLEQLKYDISEFVDVTETEKVAAEKAIKDTSNPFLALFGHYNTSSSSGGPKKVPPENFVEKTYIKPLVIQDAQAMAFKLFDTYKKVHGMNSFT